MSSKPHVAVLGATGSGGNLLRILSHLGHTVLVCEPDADLRARIAKGYPKFPKVSSEAEVFSQKSIAAVCIAGPIEQRAALTKQALAAGKHVLVDRPLLCADSEAETLYEQARRAQRILMSAHMLNYHPAFLAMARLLRDGSLGKARYIYVERTHHAHFRREEHAVYGFSPNDLAMVLDLADVNPAGITAVGPSRREGVADHTTLHLDFPSGLQAHLFHSWMHPFRRHQLVIVGSKQTAVFDETRPWEDKLRLYKSTRNTDLPSEWDDDHIAVDLTGREPLRGLCERFLDLVAQGDETHAQARLTRRVTQTLNAGLRSLQDRNSRYDLPDLSAEDTLPGGIPVAALEQARRTAAATMDHFIHPTAVVDDGVTLGSGSRVWHFAHILTGAQLGEGVVVGQNVMIGQDVEVGARCKIQNNVSVVQGVTLEDEVFVGPSVVFTNVAVPRAAISRKDQFINTRIKTGASLGANSTVRCGVSIGRYSFVEAGAHVTEDVPDHAMVAGAPAQFIDWICVCGHILSKKMSCNECGKAYVKEGKGLTEDIEEKPTKKTRKRKS